MDSSISLQDTSCKRFGVRVCVPRSESLIAEAQDDSRRHDVM